MDKAIEISLRTWYPKDHHLHLDYHHPLGKLVGEWGELLDDYMKSLYKPGYEWNPANELGDVWYYTRILSYQVDWVIENRDYKEWCKKTSHDKMMALSMKYGSEALFNYDLNKNKDKYGIDFSIRFRSFVIDSLKVSYASVVEICNRQNITLDELTDLNWQKLKPGSERGEEWMKAR